MKYIYYKISNTHKAHAAARYSSIYTEQRSREGGTSSTALALTLPRYLGARDYRHDPRQGCGWRDSFPAHLLCSRTPGRNTWMSSDQHSSDHRPGQHFSWVSISRCYQASLRGSSLVNQKSRLQHHNHFHNWGLRAFFYWFYIKIIK